MTIPYRGFFSDEGVYVNTYGKITKNVVLQWGEMPTSVGKVSRIESIRPKIFKAFTLAICTF